MPSLQIGSVCEAYCALTQSRAGFGESDVRAGDSSDAHYPYGVLLREIVGVISRSHGGIPVRKETGGRMENDSGLVDASLVLLAPAGIRRVPVGRRPLCIGSRHECDLVVAQSDAGRYREIVIWQQQGRAFRRSTPGRVEVNGHAWSWAELDDGDQIRLGDLTLALEIRGSREEQARSPRLLNDRRPHSGCRSRHQAGCLIILRFPTRIRPASS